MTRVYLSKGLYAIIDKGDFKKINMWENRLKTKAVLNHLGVNA